MTGLRALRLTLSDLWDEGFVLLSLGFIGGLLSLLIIPLPFVLAGYYGVALRIAGGRVAGWREWFRDARTHARFLYKWALLVAVVAAVLATNVDFYWKMSAAPAQVAGGVALALLVVWLLGQPFVPALHILHYRLQPQETPPGVRQSLRLAARMALRNPVATLLPWPLTFLLLLAVGALGLWPAALVVPVLWVVFATHAVALAADVVEQI